ncbi:stalk domain-containing protein [Paenibacillus durus]|uniref:Copper amine oxidase-like N-terminal domain-containing protein n=1 Tax=Paenibacillus durus ATCC 35681 TaxID=1333534 RepID=A0A0F7CID4_PAEDU|nr:stalk domain-containing protein [Paenibacillus durus]AKG35251.1 hypothetical protein VK70_12245 [Paenibacillus durus ATCC 35681]
MKRFRWLAILLTLTVVFSSLGSVVSADSSRTLVFYDAKRIVFDKDPIYYNGTMLVQVGPIIKAFGLSASYEKSTKTTTVSNTSTNTSFTFTIGSKTAWVNGKKTALNIAPKIIEGYTFVPLKFIATASNHSFVLDNNSSRIYIGPFDFSTKDPYKEIEWGRTIADVKKAENKTLLHSFTGANSAKTLMYRVYLGNDMLPAQLWYQFDLTGKLRDMYYFTEGDEYPGDQYRLFNQLISDMDSTYKPTSEDDNMLWKNEYTEEIYDDMYGFDYDTKIGTALLYKDLVLIKNYEYRDISISVQMKNAGSVNKPKYKVSILYGIQE